MNGAVSGFAAIPFPQIRKIYFCFIERIRTLIFYFSPIFKIRKNTLCTAFYFFPKISFPLRKALALRRLCFPFSVRSSAFPTFHRSSHPCPVCRYFPLTIQAPLPKNVLSILCRSFPVYFADPFSPSPVFLLAKIVKRYEKIFHIFSICLFEDQKPTR